MGTHTEREAMAAGWRVDGPVPWCLAALSLWVFGPAPAPLTCEVLATSTLVVCVFMALSSIFRPTASSRLAQSLLTRADAPATCTAAVAPTLSSASHTPWVPLSRSLQQPTTKFNVPARASVRAPARLDGAPTPGHHYRSLYPTSLAASTDDEQQQDKGPSAKAPDGGSTGHVVKGMAEMTPEQKAEQEKIANHQKDAPRLSAAEEIRTLVEYNHGFAVISTNAKGLDGYPGGSVVGFAPDELGRPVFVFS